MKFTYVLSCQKYATSLGWHSSLCVAYIDEVEETSKDKSKKMVVKFYYSALVKAVPKSVDTSGPSQNLDQMTINEAAKDWGLECLCYEISKGYCYSHGVKVAMEMQAEAERKKKAQIHESEGERQAHINIADGKKSSVILASEAAKMDQVNRSQGDVEAILAVAQATTKRISLISDAIKNHGVMEAATLGIAEQYIDAFGKLRRVIQSCFLQTLHHLPA
ncbi:hypothetical protein ACET3Z_010627 [Daucus carota]